MDRLRSFSVLGYQITGISGQGDIVDLALGPGAQIDHFADMRKMVLRLVSRVLASG